MGSKGSFAGSHRKLKCCLMRIIRYLNLKWVPSKRRNHCTPKAELRTSRAVSTSVRWLLDSCLHVSINKIIEGGGKNHRCQILLPVSFHHLAAQRRLFREKAWFVFTAVTHTQQQNNSASTKAFRYWEENITCDCHLLPSSFVCWTSFRQQCLFPINP